MIGQFQRLVEIMGDEDDGLVQLGLEVDQQILHVGADQRIERRERLVHQHDVGIAGQRAGDSNPLLHPARKLVRILLLLPLEPHAVQPFARLLGVGALALAGHSGRHARILQHRSMRQQREFLEHHGHLVLAQLAQALLVIVEDVLAIHQHLARGRVDQPVEMPDQGRFPRPRQPHDHRGLARRNVHVDVAQAQHMAVFLHQLGLAHAVQHHGQHRLRVAAEDLVKIADRDFRFLGHAPAPSILRCVDAGQRGLGHPVEDDCQEHDAEARDQPHTQFQAADAAQDQHAQPRCRDQRGDHDHG